MLSGRGTSALWYVNPRTGEVLWRLGGRRSSFDMGDGYGFWLRMSMSSPDIFLSQHLLLVPAPCPDDADRHRHFRCQHLRQRLEPIRDEVEPHSWYCSRDQHVLHGGASQAAGGVSVRKTLDRGGQHAGVPRRRSRVGDCTDLRRNEVFNDGHIMMGWGVQPQYTEFDEWVLSHISPALTLTIVPPTQKRRGGPQRPIRNRSRLHALLPHHQGHLRRPPSHLAVIRAERHRGRGVRQLERCHRGLDMAHTCGR